MTGPTPLTATHRLTMLYTVSGVQHKQQNYCNAIPSVTPSGYILGSRPGFSPPDLQDAVDAFFDKMSPFYNPSWASFNGWLLYERVGTVFNPVAGGVTPIVCTGASIIQLANGLFLTGKDLAGKNMPVSLLEGAFGSATKVSSVSGLAGSGAAITNFFWNTAGTAIDTSAYNWRVSRGFALAKRWIAYVVDTNEKMRRKRGIK